eukprot:Clim_evm7s5 gene=Clim_evmTU7s5
MDNQESKDDWNVQGWGSGSLPAPEDARQTLSQPSSIQGSANPSQPIATNSVSKYGNTVQPSAQHTSEQPRVFRKPMTREMKLTQGRHIVERDYRKGLDVRFDWQVPDSLMGKIDSRAFEATVGELNAMFADAHKWSVHTYLRGFLNCCTWCIVDAVQRPQYELALDQISDYIARKNQDLFEPMGYHLTDPRDYGLRMMEVVELPLSSRIDNNGVTPTQN